MVAYASTLARFCRSASGPESAQTLPRDVKTLVTELGAHLPRMAARGFQPQLVAAAVALSDLGVVGHLVPVRSLQESIEKLHAHCVKAPPSRVAYKECA